MRNSIPNIADAEPIAFDRAEYQRTYREFRDRKPEYRKRKKNTYMEREFVAWDGEGYNADPLADYTHRYALLANSDGATRKEYFGLDTETIFDMFLNARKGPINVGYGLNYDANMWLKDVDRESLETLYREGWVVWNRYRINWRPGKSFSVERNRKRFLIYDVLPFFQRAFVTACDEYLGNDWKGRDNIIANKARRSSFTWEEIDDVSEYNGYELENLVSLCVELRARLDRVGIRISRWDGPGAIASALFKRYETKSHLRAVPPDVNLAARYAYAGGRFEMIRQGHSDSPVWEYDINSAYPEAIAKLPCLAHGSWSHRTKITRIDRFAVYHIRYKGQNDPYSNLTNPQLLWKRNRSGTIVYAYDVDNWFWSPEAANVWQNPGAEFVEAWVWNQSCNHEPFAWVPQLYNKRAALKKAGDGAHVGLKLGLNSLYGKLAQQIGARKVDGEWKIPPYHCLEWAGWVTSHCRAKVFQAIKDHSDDVVAFETDAVFTRCPLPHLSVSNRLGDWEDTQFANLTYFKSGFYFGDVEREGDKHYDPPRPVEKSRGINRGSVKREDVIRALRLSPDRSMAVTAEQTRFVTLGQALNQRFDKWRKWFTEPRVLKVSLMGTKRIECLSSEWETKPLGDGWNETIPAGFGEPTSHPYPVVWIEDGLGFKDPDGRDLNEYRRDDYDAETDDIYY